MSDATRYKGRKLRVQAPHGTTYMSPHFKITLSALLLICVALALLLSGCVTYSAQRSHPYRGGDMPYCNGVWVTQDSRTWYCMSHVEFQRWRKRNGV